MSKGKKIALWLLGTVGLLILVAIGIGLGMFARMVGGKHHGGIAETVAQMRQVAIEPKEGFPGQHKLIILGMGIDDNWTNSDVVYTAGARTDTLFLLTLDLDTHKATLLSIPRDTYCHIAGTDIHSKINSAYETGGPDRAIATVAELLGVQADHYLVLNIDATKKMVDALGGVDLTVEHPLHYHDHWGHLSVDLEPGTQHLDGDQAVGFARYRHPDAGKKVTVEDGDERRMYRQHVLLKAMVVKAKTFTNVAQAPQLVDVAMSTIRTDFTRTQLFDLAAIFKSIQPEDIQAASLPGVDFHGSGGAWDYRIDPDKARAYVDWLVRGDTNGARQLTTVIVRNATSTPGLAQYAVNQLKQQGYADVTNGGNADRPKVHLTSAETGQSPARSLILDTGVPYPNAAQDIANLLGLSAPLSARRPVPPNKLGWTPPAIVTVTLGQDYANAVKSSGALDNNTVQPTSNTQN